MTISNHYRHVDTRRRDGAYIKFNTVKEADDQTSPGDFDCYSGKQKVAFNRGEWKFVFVYVVAHITVVRNGVGTFYNLSSPGVGGIEDLGTKESDAYIADIAREQREELLSDLIFMAENFAVEN